MRQLAPFCLLAILAACAVPPPEAYVAGNNRGRIAQAIDLGTNEVGESCIQASGSNLTADVYCGAWQQPSARIRLAGPATADTIGTLATSGPWRTSLDSRYVCPAPRATSVEGNPALQLDCTGRLGGWPHIAMVVVADGRAWLADGVTPARPAISQSIAVLSGRTAPKVVTGDAVNARLTERETAQARANGDGRAFDTLMAAGRRANLADDPVAAESAYSAALANMEKSQGPNSPNITDPLIHLALQLSNQGRYGEADALFARAANLAPQQRADATLPGRLLHYQALHAFNQGKSEAALDLLQQAERSYAATLPPEALRPRPTIDRNNLAANLEDVLSTRSDLQNQIALVGVIETKRYQAIVLRALNRPADSDSAMSAARDLSRNAQYEIPNLVARLRRTAAVNASAAGDARAAISAFSDSNAAFLRAYPGSRPLALVELLRGEELVKVGNTDAAATICRQAIRTLIEIKSGFEPERMAGCLDAFAAAAAGADTARKQSILQDMFLASQLVRSSKTEQQINQSAARLGEGGRDSRVAEAIRQQQDAVATLAAIRRRRAAEAETIRQGGGASPEATALEAREQAAITTLADRENDLQAASPNYGQLVQQASKASDVLALLNPGEAFAVITLTRTGGWTFLLRDGAVQVSRIAGGAAKIDPLVTRIRASMTAETPAFDATAAQQLYTALFGDLPTGDLEGVRALTVAPTGSLLSLPFGVLLTGPANPAALGAAPWLTRRMAIGHLPSAGNFVALRRVAGASKAPNPWFGFGDFRPVTTAQARRSFGPNCGDSAELLAHLPPLPSARQELAVAARLLGAAPTDELLGPAFTVPAVRQANLANYRVLHFATHAILPTELRCQTEPAIVTSAAPNAPDASTALLKASDLAQTKLDADLVILSACNSGGPDGSLGGGESLSSLARSFFYGGARALLITHWEVNDQAATFMIADTLRRMRAEPGAGTAAALQFAQTDILDRAGAALPAEFAHPFYWAPFALIGQAVAPPLKQASLN